MTISINVSTWDELEALARAVLHSGAGPETVKAVSAVMEKPVTKSQSTKPEPAAAEQKPAAVQSQSTKPVPEKKVPSMDDIKRRALALMDAGKQPELEKLLRNYGVLSIPELEADPVKMAAFAADLEAM